MAASFVQVHGDQGWAALNPAFAFEEERRLFGKIQGRWFEQKFKVIDEFVLELDAFADRIRRGSDPEPDGMEGSAGYCHDRGHLPLGAGKSHGSDPVRRVNGRMLQRAGTRVSGAC